ncbi:FAD-dependent oxidoreductase [bacterium]|jgi:sulfide:quinone oxidoreductase|nr:FAD-dependent oxidoreductase [bacterium]
MIKKSTHIVILGSNLAGFSGALELSSFLGNLCKITVISNSHIFTFTPALIWVPFGLEKKESLQFDVRPIYKSYNINFIEDIVSRIDPVQKKVHTKKTTCDYDYLLITTGARPNYDNVPGLRPSEDSLSICNYRETLKTKQAWESFVKNPGPIVIGMMPDALAKGAAYEFALVLGVQLKKLGLLKKAPITFLTPEPNLSYLKQDIVGYSVLLCKHLFKLYKIKWKTDTVIDSIQSGSVSLKSGEKLDSKFTMIIPSFKGAKCIQDSVDLESDNGFLPVNSHLQHIRHPDVFVAGTAIDICPKSSLTLSYHKPKIMYPVEYLAKVAVWNILAKIKGLNFKEIDIDYIKHDCTTNIGDLKVNLVGNEIYVDRNQEFLISGYQRSINKFVRLFQETFCPNKDEVTF